MNILSRIATLMHAFVAFMKKKTGTTSLQGLPGTTVGTTFLAAFGRTPTTRRDLYMLAFTLHGLRGLDTLSWLQAQGLNISDDLTWFTMNSIIGRARRTQVLPFEAAVAAYAAGGF